MQIFNLIQLASQSLFNYFKSSYEDGAKTLEDEANTLGAKPPGGKTTGYRLPLS